MGLYRQAGNKPPQVKQPAQAAIFQRLIPAAGKAGEHVKFKAMKKKHDFEILAEMSKKDQDVRAAYTVTEIKMVKQGGLVTVGVDPGTAQQLILGTAGGKDMRALLIVFDFNQFQAIHTRPEEQTPAVELIAYERAEQVSKHGYTPEWDAAYAEGQLTDAAHFALTLHGWPAGWSERVRDKIAGKTYKERLVIAGALIAAEIDRLNAEPQN